MSGRDLPPDIDEEFVAELDLLIRELFPSVYGTPE